MASLMSARSGFAGRQMAFQPARAAPAPVASSRVLVPVVQASKVCDLTGKRRNKANNVSFSNKKSRKWQEPNLQTKRIFWPYGQRYVKLKVSTKALKTLEKKGLDKMAQEAGIDLWKLPFDDVRPERLAYLEANKGKVPVAVNPRAMKNPEKIAASTKKPRVPVYTIAGRIAWVRPGTEALYTTEVEDKKPLMPVDEEEGETELKITVSE